MGGAKGRVLGQPVFRLLGGRTKPRIPVYASRLYAQPLDALHEEARSYAAQGFKAIKLRFGWGPGDGVAVMRRNVDLVRPAAVAVDGHVDLACDRPGFGLTLREPGGNFRLAR